MKIAVAAALTFHAFAFAADDGFRFTSGLGIAVPAPRSASRTMARVDALEMAIVNGQWVAPKAGMAFAGGTWSEVKAGEDGTFSGGQGTPFAGGYVHATFDAPVDAVMMLDAQGHGSVFVNGEPRGGDPYSWGFVQVPVALHKGSNDFLFSCGRGSLRARLVAPPAPAATNAGAGDVLAPNLVSGRDTDGPVGVVVVNASGAPLAGARIRVESDLPAEEAWVELHSMLSLIHI